MSELLKEFTIDRSKWACQSNNAVRERGSFLEDDDGFKCCLGFYASACKMPTGRMIKDYPSAELNFAGYCDLSSIPHDEWTTLFDVSLMKGASSTLIIVNDNKINNEAREREIARLFAKHDIKVNFVGEYLKENV